MEKKKSEIRFPFKIFLIKNKTKEEKSHFGLTFSHPDFLLKNLFVLLRFVFCFGVKHSFLIKKVKITYTDSKN